jgi:rod shape-determining protein MreC
MAVVAPDGIVGKVVAAYPTSSLVQLVTDPNFAAGVISQKSRARGILRGLDGGNACRVDYIATEHKVEVGEWFFTSGEDRVFPKGLPAGRVKSVERGAQFQKVIVEPTGTLGGLEEVLVVVETVHGEIPEGAEPLSEVYVAPPPPEEHTSTEGQAREGFTGTDADLLMERYRAIGASQGLRFGETSARPPDFNAPIRPPAVSSGPAGAPDGEGAAGAAPGEVPARSPQTATAVAKPATSDPAPPAGSAAPLSPERRR